MAFWRNIKQSHLKCLSNQFRRSYSQIHGPCSVIRTTSHASLSGLDNPSRVIHQARFEVLNNVRFFAAPVQFKPKQEEKEMDGPRLNEQISAQYVRLVTDEGHGIVSRYEALQRAKRLKLDLVEVQRTAKPPVCKLMDYHKEKYKQQIKEKDRTKSKTEVTLRKGVCKEVRFTRKIDQKDLQMKADMAKRLMERGYRVKCMAMAIKEKNSGTKDKDSATKDKDSSTADQDLGGLLSRLSALIEDVAIVESGPRVEKKQAYVIVRHVKFGPTKKGSGKKVSQVVDATSTKVVNPLQSEDNWDDAESGFETEDDILSEEEPTSPLVEMTDDLANNKSTWSVLDEGDDFEKVFDFRNDVNRVAQSSRPSAPSSASPTFGRFSVPEANNNPGKQHVPPEVNRYKRANPNSPASNLNGSRRPDFNKGAQGRLGVFRADNHKQEY